MQIRVPEVRLIDEKGEQLGVVSIQQALEAAGERGLDLIEVGPKSKPPVCKLMNYGKYLYRKAKEDRLQKAKQKKIEVKSMRLSVRTGEHDLAFKAKKVKDFLEDGDKVKVEIVLKGREKQHFDLAKEKLIKFLDNLGEIKFEQEIKRVPQGLVVVVGK